MKCGHKVCFHGAFKTKHAAIVRERKVSGGFIRKIKVHGHTRYSVMSLKK